MRMNEISAHGRERYATRGRALSRRRCKEDEKLFPASNCRVTQHISQCQHSAVKQKWSSIYRVQNRSNKEICGIAESHFLFFYHVCYYDAYLLRHSRWTNELQSNANLGYLKNSYTVYISTSLSRHLYAAFETWWLQHGVSCQGLLRILLLSLLYSNVWQLSVLFSKSKNRSSSPTKKKHLHEIVKLLTNSTFFLVLYQNTVCDFTLFCFSHL